MLQPPSRWVREGENPPDAGQREASSFPSTSYQKFMYIFMIWWNDVAIVAHGIAAAAFRSVTRQQSRCVRLSRPPVEL
eukprot:scaffold7041_cov311-Pinguiococcus_pyrenoidosus.AAC.8